MRNYYNRLISVLNSIIFVFNYGVTLSQFSLIREIGPTNLNLEPNFHQPLFTTPRSVEEDLSFTGIA